MDGARAAAEVIRSIDMDEVLEKVGGEIDRRDHLANGPARLWMHEGSSAPWFVKPAGNSTEYVRADLSPAPDAVARLVEAARAMRSAICGPDGFAECVRRDSGLAYPWPALEIAESLMDAALAAMETSHD